MTPTIKIRVKTLQITKKFNATKVNRASVYKGSWEKSVTFWVIAHTIQVISYKKAPSFSYSSPTLPNFITLSDLYQTTTFRLLECPIAHSIPVTFFEGLPYPQI